MNTTTHWTEQSPEDFLYSIASDFVEQLQSKMKALDDMTRAKLAKVAGISKGRISQIFNDPGNISLDTVVRLAHALGMKVAVVAYEDTDDLNNERGPINAEIFRLCWERANRPADMWAFNESVPVAPVIAGAFIHLPKGHHGAKPADGDLTVSRFRDETTKGSYTRPQLSKPLDVSSEKYAWITQPADVRDVS